MRAKRIVPLERDVQKAITDVLELAGFTVRHTSAFKQKGGSGCDNGIPDLLLCHPFWPHFYVGLEVKRPGGRLSPEQKVAVASGEYDIVEGPAEALKTARTRFMIQEGVAPESWAKIEGVLRALEKA